MAYATKAKADVYSTITNTLIEQIEAGAGQWVRPWNTNGGFSMPVNVTNKKQYRGINTVMLILAANKAGHSNNLWATYKQWSEKKAQVRAGEKSTTIVFWGTYHNELEDGSEKDVMYAKLYNVFNVAQVDGFELPTVSAPISEQSRIYNAETYFHNTRAITRNGGNRAYYSIDGDCIQLPNFSQFPNPLDYYATQAHEMVHWTGHKSRCNREFGTRFGNATYAFEELIADIGSAFVCSLLGLVHEPRKDHAQYLASWLQVLKSDKKAIFTAASAAQKAVDYLESLQPVELALAA